MNNKLEIDTAKAIHIYNSHEPTLKPKIAKEYVLLTLRNMLTKLKEIEGMNKDQHLTKAIRNVGNMLYMNIIAINKISDKLKINSFKFPKFHIAIVIHKQENLNKMINLLQENIEMESPRTNCSHKNRIRN